ncbi:hypothetical protein [Ralstonia holmesii]|uniref:Uncharacterized protein n=1 Tax=Ralstonia holmesii TaxID=3058602 RepID=A0ABC8QEK1_9RALS|nr:hypothetical protein [Ralstonia sp. LMG 32967]CAJ0797277.1 hypothetical protein LMG18096_03381 [Ralstonia sp. LMG 32967]CAJ0806235.1 hypothetical protein LMG18093_00151 [Ralstonia sp. LMG 32967]
MDAAEKHEKRYRAVIQKSWDAFLRLSALEEWAIAKDLPVSFVRAFPWDGDGDAPPHERQFIHYLLISFRIGDLFKENAGDHAIARYAERLGASKSDREAAALVMVAEMDRRILCAVFDGELTLYDSAFLPIDVAGERKNYEAHPEYYLRSIESRSQGTETETPVQTIVPLSSCPVALPNKPLLTADGLAQAIAFAMVEIPDDEILTTVKKAVPAGAGVSHIESLTSDDWRLIREICGGNPPAPCSRAGFESYWAKFNAATNRPAWSLEPKFRYSDAMVKAQNAHNEIYLQHREQIGQWVRDGKLSLVTSAGIETTNPDEGCIRIADAKAYLDQYCIPYRDTEETAEGTGNSLSVNGKLAFVESGARGVGSSAAAIQETPQERRQRVTAVVARHGGNMAAAARELGITGERVRQLVTPKSKSSRTATNPNDPFNRTPLTKSKRTK